MSNATPKLIKPMLNPNGTNSEPEPNGTNSEPGSNGTKLKDLFSFGRTVQSNSAQYRNFIEIACNIQNREGIINILLNNGEPTERKLYINPNIYRPQSEFKYNLFDSRESNIFIIEK